jgi:hypothetical protein
MHRVSTRGKKTKIPDESTSSTEQVEYLTLGSTVRTENKILTLDCDLLIWIKKALASLCSMRVECVRLSFHIIQLPFLTQEHKSAGMVHRNTITRP